MDDTGVDLTYKSDFELVFGCRPEKLIKGMQSISDAFAAPQANENVCKDCLGADFMKEIINFCQGSPMQPSRFWTFGQGESDDYYSAEAFLSQDDPSCYFCDFLRIRLRKQLDHDVEPGLTQKYRMNFRFGAPGDRSLKDQSVFFMVGPVDVQDSYTCFMYFALTPLVGDQTKRPFSYPVRLRFSSGSPKDETSQLRIRQWVQDCHGHPQCESPKASSLPARVIDVGTYDDPDLRLRISKTSESDDYIALSYCWGGYDGIKLTQRNLEAFKQGIDESQLPKTYTDAVALTRQLGKRYLWIDALCIVQDCESDWEAQSTTMHDVYGYSFLTICASNASTPSQGFLKERDITSYTHAYCGNLSHEGLCYPIYLTDCRQTATESLHDLQMGALKHDPLTSRAWAVQERLMSRRILYFTDQEMIWQCRQGTYTEGGISVGPQPGLFAPNKSLARQIWYDIVEIYSDCSLSNSKDRLPAIVGCAREFASSHHDMDYLAGHWIDGILESLVWWRRQEGDKSPRLAPSWSWASMNRGVIFHEPSSHELVPIADLLEHNAGEPQTHLSTSFFPAFLKIRAPMATGTIFNSGDPYEKSAKDYVRLDRFPHMKIQTQSILDDKLPFGTPVAIAILHRCREILEGNLQRYCGLVLKRVDEGGTAEYQRIGTKSRSKDLIWRSV